MKARRSRSLRLDRACVTNAVGKIQGVKVCMKINNTFMNGQTIVHPNSEFETLIKTTDLSDVQIKLVDAFLNEIHLLTPMYLTIHVEAVPDEELPPDYTNGESVKDLSLYKLNDKGEIVLKEVGDKNITYNGLEAQQALIENMNQPVNEQLCAEVIQIISEAEEGKRIAIQNENEKIIDSFSRAVNEQIQQLTDLP